MYKKNDNRRFSVNQSTAKIYSVNELLIEYPTFTRYSLDKAIKENGLPFFKIGNKRYFEKESIEKWINNTSSSLNEKKKQDGVW